MAHIRVAARTKRGKQLIQAHGPIWRVLRTQDSVACFDGRPGLFIESAREPGRVTTRWIERDGSPNFTTGEHHEQHHNERA